MNALFSALADSETLVYDKSEAIFSGIKDVSRVLFDHSAATHSDIQTCVDWFESFERLHPTVSMQENAKLVENSNAALGEQERLRIGQDLTLVNSRISQAAVSIESKLASLARAQEQLVAAQQKHVHDMASARLQQQKHASDEADRIRLAHAARMSALTDAPAESTEEQAR